MTPTEDYFICRELSCLEGHFQKLQLLLPRKIALMESIAHRMPEDLKTIHAKLVAREKIILFCAQELAKVGYTPDEEAILRKYRDQPMALLPNEQKPGTNNPVNPV